MSIQRVYRIKLRSLKAMQARALRRAAGCGRWIWNEAIREQQRRRALGEKHASFVQMCKWLTTWRNAPKTAWLAESASPPQQQVLRRLDAAYQRFFEKKSGYPSFKRYGDEPALRYPAVAHFELDAANQRIKAMRLGWMRMRLSQPIEGELKNLSLKREGDSWFASVQVEVPETIPALGLAPTLGIDLGVVVFAATSEGKIVKPLQALARQQVRLRRYQRSVSRKVKGSANRKKAVARLGNLHRRIARQRSDWLHQMTSQLANQHPVIALEDLRIKNMTGSAKGTASAPGKNVRQKAGLNRSILDAAWGEFSRQLDYKTGWRGGDVIYVDPAYTSQTCSACGHCSAENRKSQSLFKCVACGHTENADTNAAKNILAAGHAAWIERATTARSDACGGDVRRASVARPKRASPAKQEPTEARVLV